MRVSLFNQNFHLFVFTKNEHKKNKPTEVSLSFL